MELNRTAGVIEDLVETLEDGYKGFKQAADKLENDGRADVAADFMRFADQRRSFSAELRELAVKAGHTIEEDGSLGGALHRGWIALKDALTGDNASAIISAAKTGENHAVTEYEEALANDALTPEMRDVVARQLDEIKSVRDKVDALA